jgi:hypothetical protein
MSDDQFRHRKSAVTVKVLVDGKPAANRPVKIKQTGHEFLFGVGGFDAVELMGEPSLSDERKAVLQERLDRIFSVMNYATLPFYLGRYEPKEGFPDEARTMAATEYYRSKGVKMKGHPLV